MLECAVARYPRPQVRSQFGQTGLPLIEGRIEDGGADREQTAAQGDGRERQWHFAKRVVGAKLAERERGFGEAVEQVITQP